jgi:hypothetical protein
MQAGIGGGRQRTFQQKITKRDQDMVILILIGEGRESVIDTGQGGHWISPASLWQVLAVPVFDLDFEMGVGCCCRIQPLMTPPWIF